MLITSPGLRLALRNNELQPIGAGTDVFRLTGENVPGLDSNNSSFDTGSGRAPVTRSDPIKVRRYQDRTTGVPWSGRYSALWTGTTTDYAEFPYKADSTARAGSGNAIGSTDFYIGGVIYLSGSVGNFSPVTVEDSSQTAAGSAWGFVIDSTGALTFFYSDGTNRYTITAKSVSFSTAGIFLLAAERIGKWIYLSVNGTVLAVGAINFALNIPSGGTIRFGKTKASNAGVAGAFWDNWQIKRHSLYNGGHFTKRADFVRGYWPGPVGSPVDPYYSLTVLDCDFSTASGHGIVDLSSSPATLTNNGTATISTAVDPFGDNTGMLSLDGSTKYITTNRAPGITTGAFTFECIFRVPSVPAATSRLVNAQVVSNQLVSLYINSTGQLAGVMRDTTGGTTLAIFNPTAVLANTYYHCALTRSASGAVNLWQGVLGAKAISVASGSFSLSVSGLPNYAFGCLGGNTQILNGYMRAARVTEGIDRYTAPYYTPAAMYPLTA